MRHLVDWLLWQEKQLWSWLQYTDTLIIVISITSITLISQPATKDITESRQSECQQEQSLKYYTE